MLDRATKRKFCVASLQYEKETNNRIKYWRSVIAETKKQGTDYLYYPGDGVISNTTITMYVHNITRILYDNMNKMGCYPKGFDKEAMISDLQPLVAKFLGVDK